jgi:hypothetical protein
MTIFYLSIIAVESTLTNPFVLTQEDGQTANERANILNFVMTPRGQANHYHVESSGNRTMTESRTRFHLGRSADLLRAADIGTRPRQGVISGRVEHTHKLKWRESEKAMACSIKCSEESGGG